MTFYLDIRRSIIDQFAEQLNVEVEADKLTFPSALARGFIEVLKFPESVEFYYLSASVNTPIAIQSMNPSSSNWVLFNINLSSSQIVKTVNDQVINLQKYLPSGVLFYAPGTHVQSKSTAGTTFEIALIRIHKDFLTKFRQTKLIELRHSENALLYEDLEYQMESALKSVIQHKDNILRSNAFLMQFIADISEKFRARENISNYKQLHPDDIKGLFLVAAHLRNPLNKNIPTIVDLAKIAGMGNTKFKTTFKQVFGKAPRQYHHQIKFDYAKQELGQKRKTISEVSYELGYSHPSKFTSAFKKLFGITPSQLK